MEIEFDFAALDDLALAAERGILSQTRGQALQPRRIGPMVELEHLVAGAPATMSVLREWISPTGLTAFRARWRSGTNEWLCPETGNVGFRRVAPGGAFDPDSVDRTYFLTRVERAAVAGGFHPKAAPRFAAAIRELEENIFEHSRAPETGITAFQAHQHGFEFVVADLGVGMLATLREAPEYSDMVDHGDALRYGLGEGNSRFGRQSGHGFGFRPIFTGLANHKGWLRFRSGDHAFVLDGQDPSAAFLQAKVPQKPCAAGFFVSVYCQP